MPRVDKKSSIKVIDLFCGIGGLTHGLVREGLPVALGIDNDMSCGWAYEKNNSGAKFRGADVRDVTADELRAAFGDAKIKVLVGCAPCQPFSDMNTRKGQFFGDAERANSRSPLDKFASFVEELLPDIVSMENVANLKDTTKYPAFAYFVHTLEKNGYSVWYDVVDTSTIGVPQTRRRLVLLASRLGQIRLSRPKYRQMTVRDAFKGIGHVGIGVVHKKDSHHRTQDMSPLNRERICAIEKDGGTLARSAPHLMPKCHTVESGKGYRSGVYGRMRWDTPAPTLTTNCLGLGNGRYGHPEENRTISLREAMRIQTFPDTYQLAPDPATYSLPLMAKYVGNAVPVRLGEVIGKSIKEHLQSVQLTF